MNIFLRVLTAFTLTLCLGYFGLYHVQRTIISSHKYYSKKSQLFRASGPNIPVNNLDQYNNGNNWLSNSPFDPWTQGHVTSNQKPEFKELAPEDQSTSIEHKLILLTYMRSGSTLTGSLFDEHPSVFYMYEPLWTIRRAYEGLIELRDINRTEINITGKKELFRLKGIDTMRSILDCHFENLDPVTLSQVHMKRSKSTYNYSECLNIAWEHDGGYNAELVRRTPNCIKLLTSKCLQSKVTAIKVIEASMEQIETIMASDIKVKVLHLVRDPRGVINSRKLFGIPYSFDPGYIHSVCLRVLDDIQTSRTLSKMFPDRILTVRYEDIVSDPILATQKMYQFLGLRVSSRMKMLILEMTSAGLPDGCNVCPVRGNATETASNWRRKLNFKTVVTIQEECQTLLEVMGYMSFRSEQELKNYNTSSTFDDYDRRLMKVSVKS